MQSRCIIICSFVLSWHTLETHCWLLQLASRDHAEADQAGKEDGDVVMTDASVPDGKMPLLV